MRFKNNGIFKDDIFTINSDWVVIKWYLVMLRFDFGTSENTFVLSDRAMYQSDSIVYEGAQLITEDFPDGEAVLVYLMELSFFEEKEGSTTPYPKAELTRFFYFEFCNE